MTNEEQVVLYQQGNKHALEQLIENNQKFIYKIINKFYTERINAIDKEDLMQHLLLMRFIGYIKGYRGL